MFFTQKMIKNLIFNKTKNTSVRFFIYMSSRCVHILVSALKSNMAAIPMETKRGEIFLFFLHIFHTDHNKCTMKWLG